ncbi:MAG: ABC transporter permease subunit [Dialister invisus]
MGDLVRGALISIPKSQHESAEALGLSRRQMYRFIIIPQSLRRLLPPAINLFTRIIKTTSRRPHRCGNAENRPANH